MSFDLDGVPSTSNFKVDFIPQISFASIILPYIHCSVARCFGLMKTTKEEWMGSNFEGTSGTSVKLQAHLVGVQLRIQSGLIS